MTARFTKILADGVRKGKLPARSSNAKEWFRERARSETISNTKTMITEMAKKDRDRSKPILGRMFLFGYDPKLKNSLPYWDAFPLVFPIAVTSSSMLAINFHYLPYQERAKLMDALYSLTNNKNYDETTKLQISYEILKAASKFRQFKPCIKRYLLNHIKTQLVEVYSAEYDIALFLPLAKFQGATQEDVWKDSRKIIRRS